MRMERSITIIFFFLLVMPAMAQGTGGSCSSYTPQYSCSPGCSTCTYYTFTPASVIKDVNRIPFDLSVFKPSEAYCDLDGESQLNSNMKRLPFKLGSTLINRIPQKVSLSYSKIGTGQRSGPSCDDKCYSKLGTSLVGAPDVIIFVPKKSSNPGRLCRYTTVTSGTGAPGSPIVTSTVCNFCECRTVKYTCHVPTKITSQDLEGRRDSIISSIKNGSKPRKCSWSSKCDVLMVPHGNRGTHPCSGKVKLSCTIGSHMVNVVDEDGNVREEERPIKMRLPDTNNESIDEVKAALESSNSEMATGYTVKSAEDETFSCPCP